MTTDHPARRRKFWSKAPPTEWPVSRTSWTTLLLDVAFWFGLSSIMGLIAYIAFCA